MTMTITKLVEHARNQLSALTGLPLESTVEIRKDDNGAGWTIGVELLQKTSIPDSQDLLATYEASLDPKGNLMSFQRMGMRKRMESAGGMEA